MLPFDQSMVFKGSYFFTQPDAPSALPSPEEARMAAAAAAPNSKGSHRPRPLRLPALNLLVKFGRTITIAEGQCLWAIRHLLPQVPVPEVYGWCRDGQDIFIYMQLMPGCTLEERWQTLLPEDKRELCEQLRGIVGSLRRLEQDPSDRFIGHVGRQPLLDIVFDAYSNSGPFLTVPAFHDYFSYLPLEFKASMPHPFRSKLIDDVPIVFTHSDLHLSNMIVSAEGDGTPRVVAIIDWHQSGWYPSYWEYCKARLTAEVGSEWETGYLWRILQPTEQWEDWNYFCLKLGV
ncbi:kinase-like domain-containing protein [Sparassis latifolia]